ncbi:MAG TPA: alpha-glucan family phosphorylase [Candidatus Dormibacteraeota bacterium]|nr:alpha-glucan family phosphorylase [Candidatus Dormibacteraeota bacterium]
MSTAFPLPAPLSEVDGRANLERAVGELAERLPEAIRSLAFLAYNYRWAWMLDGPDVFRELDALAWRRSSGNPRYVIEVAPPRRLQELARSEDYLRRVQALADAVAADLARPARPVAGQTARPVAYFCSEFGAHPSLALYGGGLGVLAGDTLKAAADLAVPMVGVGLFYRQGYFHQRLDVGGWQHEYWLNADIERLPAVRVTNGDQQPLLVQVQIRDRTVHCEILRVDIGRVPLYLLNTDREDNHPIDRWITARLYIGDRHTRLAQYAVLGIGGVRALQALGIDPILVHLNEGHAALSGFERARLRANGSSFEAALADVKQHTVFTTHTPVPAGNEGYTVDEIDPALGSFADSLGIERAAFYDYGRVSPGDAGDPVSITPLALRTCGAANGVSARHGEVARHMWRPLWPDLPVEQVPITHVTNGVHTTTWMAAPMQRLLDRHLPGDWRARVSDPVVWEAIDHIPDADLWGVRCELRRELVDLVRDRSVRDRLSRGEPPEYVEAAAREFDPNVITIGFARRVAAYKRLYLLVRFPERGGDLLGDGPTSIQVIVSGKAHPQDNEGKETLHRLFQSRSNVVGGRVVFLEDYDLRIAPPLVAGVDLWLNLPRPPLEASGTSGMKVVLNGGLNLSVADGWWEEAYDGSNGWNIVSPAADAHAQDEHDAEALVTLMQNEVVPLFYARGPDGIPHAWVQRMKNSMRGLIPRFSAQRMLLDYVTRLYAGGAEDAVRSSPPPVELTDAPPA